MDKTVNQPFSFWEFDTAFVGVDPQSVRIIKILAYPVGRLARLTQVVLDYANFEKAIVGLTISNLRIERYWGDYGL